MPHKYFQTDHRAGNLATDTSTSGMTNKKFGRIGDAPVIGAGTCAQLKYKGASLKDAAAATLAKVGKLGGGVCLDKDGNVAMPFNTAGMDRGYRRSTGPGATEIFWN